jgi:hypothetical protein
MRKTVKKVDGAKELPRRDDLTGTALGRGVDKHPTTIGIERARVGVDDHEDVPDVKS